jgi:outer membrane lipoprotein-sorting protein|tara:strand:+ start:1546 stop:2121 length:576 start_codon:yes stop_codon:yes gene_type:complete
MAYVFKTIIAATFIGMASVASADKLPLNDISKYLNALKTASGDFTQINDDGTISTGKIYIKRPGRMRFEYEDAVVLANNGAVLIIDKKSNQSPETYPLKRTPLSLILARNVNLGQAKMVVGHDYDGTATVVKAQDPKNPEYGNIELKFTSNPVELRQWVINDAQGGRSTVILGALTKGGSISNRLFEVDPR